LIDLAAVVEVEGFEFTEGGEVYALGCPLLHEGDEGTHMGFEGRDLAFFVGLGFFEVVVFV
jgi:hypothetical protein